MKPFALLLAALSCTTLFAQAPESSFRIGTWNLEFLGAAGSFRNNLPLRDDADYAAIGKKVVEIGVAVLAVQEICGEAPLRKVAAGAGPEWTVLLGTTGGWDDGKTAQNIGFLYDRAQVELLAAEELLQLPRTANGLPIFHRVPVTACFKHKRSGCDFRLVTVHLKAGQKADDELKRAAESRLLAGWLDALQQNPGEDADIVLLGDFNATYGTVPETNFEQSQLRRYLAPAVATPTIMHFPEPIDQVVVGSGFHELRSDSFTVDGDCDGMPRDAWRKTYSDHFPVTVTLAARSDDDPDATFARGAKEQWLPRPAATPVAAAQDPSAAATAWPPKLGTLVSVTTESGTTDGELAAHLGDSHSGWVVLRTARGILAFPAARVLSIRVQ
ncbi:MAG: endonuclease/exonuclease/phosphatase family protein [Planctomycetota bacterium]